MKRQTTFACLAVVAAALLGGCDSEPDRSVRWYLDHPAEMRAKLIECSQQAELQSQASGNCARARQAGAMDRPSGRAR